MTSSLRCALAGKCSGCPWIETPYERQTETKAKDLVREWAARGLTIPEIEMVTPGSGRLRDRADLTLERSPAGPQLGLFEMGGRRVIGMPECPQMSESLEQWLREFKSDLPDIAKGSVRLRVSPSGARGVWLDFANADIKALLDDGAWLGRLLDRGAVEMGQKRKRVEVVSGKIKLTAPKLENWFETYLGEAETPAPLYSSIGSFTQPGFKANRALVGTLKGAVRAAGGLKWMELFCGIGNFTLPMISWGLEMSALELDDGAVEGVKRALQDQGWTDKLNLFRDDAYRKGPNWSLAGLDGLLVDPPRSGLRGLLKNLGDLEPGQRPRTVVYVSCFAPSLLEDSEALASLGYTPARITGVDQFPQSPHCEWITLFKLK